MQNEMDDLKSAYNRELGAQKLDFDNTVATLLANQEKLREEQREAMHVRIEAEKRKPKSKQSGGELVMELVSTLGTVALSAMGIPVGFVGPLLSLLSDGGSEY